MSTERGFALLAVLWAGILLALIAGGMAFGARVETRLATGELERAQAAALADAGVRLGILALLARPGEQRWQADGSPHEVTFEGATIRVRLSPASARIDLNRAPDALIRGAVEAAAAGLEVDAEAVSDAILDWRDPDHQARPAGAEDDDYAAAGLPYGAADAPFAALAELALVRGMTAELLERLRPLLTVHSGRPWVDPRAASAAVLGAIPDLPGEALAGFLEEREARRAAGEPPPRAETLAALSPHLVIARSNAYAIAAEVVTGKGPRVERRALVRLAPRRRPRPYWVIEWHDVEPRAASGDNAGTARAGRAARADLGE